MRKLIQLLLILMMVTPIFSSGKSKEIIEKAYNKRINITPAPLELVEKAGTFTLNKNVVFVSDNADGNTVADYFAAKMKKATGYDLKTVKQQPSKNYITLAIAANIGVNDEGYTLNVSPEGIQIKAKTPHGLFYGMQTVMQLLPAEIESETIVKNIAWTMPAVTVKDEPRFKYRGMHLDVCRHFADIDFIKKQLDVLAMFKINKFHWHLTEDQGWRIEIKKYPKLTQIGGKRIEGEGNTYGPFFYTQEQVKEIVAYAKQRFIEVIPEIELPGHAVSALAGYPEFSCKGEPLEVRNVWGISDEVFCAGNDGTFRFLEDIISEVIPLFESEYFHIGGDESPKTLWKECPKCQARIKELGLTEKDGHSAEERLQSYFVQRIEKFLLTKNKKMIGWDEILEGGLAPSATVMSWRGEKGGIAAGNMGHNVIMTPGNWLYLDHFPGDPKLQPVTIGGYTTLAETYSYEPIPEALDEDKRHHILGAQGNAWTEYKYTMDGMEHDIYPRIIALAELTWSAKEKKNYEDFERRIDNQRVRLDMHNINYYIPMPEQVTPSCNFVAFTDKTLLEFKTTEPVKMVYTTDGSEPNLQSKVYSQPLEFRENTTLKIRSVLLSDKMGETRTITVEKQTYAPALTNEKVAPGLHTEYYKGLCRTLAELEGKTLTETERIVAPNKVAHRIRISKQPIADEFYSTVLTGHITIPEDGIYYFSTNSEMWLDGNLLISNEKDNLGTARRHSRSDKSIALAKGVHSIKLVQLGAIFGGWPSQWEQMPVSIRPEGEPKFKQMDETYFKSL